MANRFDIALKKPVKKEPDRPNRAEQPKVKEKPSIAQVVINPQDFPSVRARRRETSAFNAAAARFSEAEPPRYEDTPAGMQRHNDLLQDNAGMTMSPEGISEGRGSGYRNFSIVCPGGYRVSIPIRFLDIRRGGNDEYNQETQVVITLPTSNANAIFNDIEQARRRMRT